LSIDRTSNLIRLIESLRQQVGAAKVGAAASSAQNIRQSPETIARPTKKTDRALELKSLERKLNARIGQLQRSQSDSFEVSMRIFIEGVLVWEFGEALSHDPRFHRMVDEIVETVKQNKELQEDFTKLFANMKSAQGMP
jgi:hypothetical protein